MNDLLQSAKIAIKLESALVTMKRLHGDNWNERAEPYRAVLNGVMASEGCGPLEAALPIANGMSKAGVSPVMLLAVAAEICDKSGRPEAKKPEK